MNGIGKRLKSRLEHLDMKQSELASKLNISISTLNGYFTEYREPDLKTIIRLADELDTSVEYLATGHEVVQQKTEPEITDPNITTMHRIYNRASAKNKEKFMKLLDITFDEEFPEEENEDDDAVQEQKS